MTYTFGHLGGDAHYLEATARMFGWRVVGDPDRAARIQRGPWTVRVLFGPTGGFRRAWSCGAVGGEAELGLAAVVGLLEREGTATTPAA
jgi:hypothetical protein